MPRTQPNSHSPSPSPSPPPAPQTFSFSQGFDFPQASASPPRRSQTSARSRVNQLTEFLNQHYHNTEPDDAAQRRRLQRLRRPRTPAVPSHAEREPPEITQPDPTIARRAQAHRRQQARQRSAIARMRDDALRDALRSRSAVEEAAADILDSLSDLPPEILTSRRARSPTSGADRPRRQVKRRKIRHLSCPASEYDGFKYGYKGQVTRGRLRMEVVSCDGGEYDRDSALYKVQNVLSNDKSVYCSQSARCNLLLKHIGEMPFCLEKVVIRAPDRGFTAPVQEGLIFVSLSPDKLLSGTSAYQIEYNQDNPRTSPPLSATPSLPEDPEEPLLTFEEAVLDDAVWERSRQAMTERIERLRLRNRRLGVPSVPPVTRDYPDNQQSDNEDDGQNECPYHIEEGESNAAGVSAPTPPPFTTTTESEPEDSEESEEMPSAAIMADRLRRESRYRSEGEDDDEREDLFQHPFATLRRAEPLGATDDYGDQQRRWRHQRYHEPIRATRLRTPSRIEPKRTHADSEDIIQPHARFFIARHKNKITIKFHPAISGRHVLLKLWSPSPMHDGNIDIESVQFYGYSGPRSFPAVQLR